MQVSGVVTDATDGSTLIGASVVVKGTSVGTSTDLDGRYTISAPADAVLEFVYVGYVTAAVPVNGRTTVDVALKTEAEALDDVIIVAYGSVKREAKTGSVTSVKGDVIAESPVSSVDKMLAGK
ncbi:MAG: carboxypeptidase-like regulatory domain-containing protein, partial [Bacteroidales bacterium]|nr:carboxypeptidase-like regulatory domain-containing protein [Bacteroidales bacterium]